MYEFSQRPFPKTPHNNSCMYCRLLKAYQGETCCFNDDIQGTACVVLAGVLSAIRATGKSMSEQKFLFSGAGEAGIGIGALLSAEIARQSGKSIKEARQHCLFMASKV